MQCLRHLARAIACRANGLYLLRTSRAGQVFVGGCHGLTCWPGVKTCAHSLLWKMFRSTALRGDERAMAMIAQSPWLSLPTAVGGQLSLLLYARISRTTLPKISVNR